MFSSFKSSASRVFPLVFYAGLVTRKAKLAKIAVSAERLQPIIYQ
jgi:hypothetical protein